MSELNRIMAVEDEPDIRLVLEVALEEVGGYHLRICSSGPEALDAAPDFQPDLILLDVMMPEMDGPATLERLRQLDGVADTPVIFLTAKVQTDEIERFRSLGALAVISKPFDPMTLADEVQRTWDQGT